MHPIYPIRVGAMCHIMAIEADIPFHGTTANLLRLVTTFDVILVVLNIQQEFHLTFLATNFCQQCDGKVILFMPAKVSMILKSCEIAMFRSSV